jgi:16S rRNA (guanine1516-N2)-methyltransferase
LPLFQELSTSDQEGVKILLELDEGQLYLRLSDWAPRARLSLDFLGGKLGYRQAQLKTHSELLRRATGIQTGQRLRLVDATAGMGTDSLILAAMGFEVLALERHPVLALMLNAALARAQASMDAPAYLRQIRFLGADAVDWLRHNAGAGSDVIYLDPMFPERQKAAQVKKPMQLLQVLLEETPDDGGGLLEAALQTARYRVVVKRPLRAPWLADRQPSHQIKGSNIRFDIYALRSIRQLVKAG